MEFVISLFCFLIFFYFLYILGKDDYYLMRKNFLIEHLFDFTFVGIFTGFILGRIISIVVHASIRGAVFSLTDMVLGCLLAFYLIGKYQKLALARLFDFLSLAFLACLPVWYLLNIFFVKKNEVIIYIAVGLCYLVVFIIFWRVLLPQIIGNKHREGSLTSLFLIMFSFLTLLASFTHKFFSPFFLLEIEDILLTVVFLVSFVYLFRAEKKWLFGRKT